MGAKLHEGIHQQGSGIEGGCIGHGLGQPELMRDAIDLPDTMPSVRRVPQIKAGQMRQRHYRFCRAVPMLDGRKENNLRLEAWNPEQGLSVRWGFGVGREIATPNASRRFPVGWQPVSSSVIWSRSRDDSPHCDEDTPRRIRRRGWFLRARKRPEHANQYSTWRHLPIPGGAGQRPDREISRRPEVVVAVQSR